MLISTYTVPVSAQTLGHPESEYQRHEHSWKPIAFSAWGTYSPLWHCWHGTWMNRYLLPLTMLGWPGYPESSQAESTQEHSLMATGPLLRPVLSMYSYRDKKQRQRREDSSHQSKLASAHRESQMPRSNVPIWMPCQLNVTPVQTKEDQLSLLGHALRSHTVSHWDFY